MSNGPQVLSLYVVWEPKFSTGESVARAIFEHYTRPAVIEAGGGIGTHIERRSAPGLGGGPLPDPAPITATACTVVVVLVDQHMGKAAAQWQPYLHAMCDAMDAAPHRNRVIPVAMDDDAYDFDERIGELNFVRWKDWLHDPWDRRERRLLLQLTDACCRLLRDDLALGDQRDTPGPLGRTTLENFRVFVSHAKRDGASQAKAFRQYLADESGFDTFFDVHEIPVGVNFVSAIKQYIGMCAVVAFQTDAFSGRPVCQLEVLEAKRQRVPMVVVNLLTHGEDRGFPYLGNVPVVRVDLNSQPQAFERLTGVLLDEILKDLYWQCTVARLPAGARNQAVFLPRPPELAALVDDLAAIAQGATAIRHVVHPDPPLASAEKELLEKLLPGISIESFRPWVAKNLGGSVP